MNPERPLADLLAVAHEHDLVETDGDLALERRRPDVLVVEEHGQALGAAVNREPATLDGARGHDHAQDLVEHARHQRRRAALARASHTDRVFPFLDPVDAHDRRRLLGPRPGDLAVEDGVGLGTRLDDSRAQP